MREKIKAGGHNSPYRLRKQLPEPVFGQIKQARGFRQFLLRGVEKVRAEWGIVCTAHNLLKLAQGRSCPLRSPWPSKQGRRLPETIRCNPRRHSGQPATCLSAPPALSGRAPRGPQGREPHGRAPAWTHADAGLSDLHLSGGCGTVFRAIGRRWLQ